MQRKMTDAEIIAGLKKRPLDKYAREAARRLEELTGATARSAHPEGSRARWPARRGRRERAPCL